MMERRKKTHAGQASLDYAVFIAVVVTALIGMNTYINRAIQGNLKVLEDQLNELPAPSTSVTPTFPPAPPPPPPPAPIAGGSDIDSGALNSNVSAADGFPDSTGVAATAAAADTAGAIAAGGGGPAVADGVTNGIE